jgi:ABC-2 type transport system permease protein
MRETLLLYRLFFTTSTGLKTFVYNVKNNKKKLWQLLLFAGFALYMLPFYMGYIGIVKGMYQGFAMVDNTQVIIGFSYTAAFLVTFIFGITHVLSVYYYSSDNIMLIPLPFKKRNIIAAKFLNTITFEYIFLALLLIPIYIVYGISSGASVIFYILSFVALLTSPVIPIAVIGILMIGMMRLTGLSEKKEAIRVIMLTLVFVMIFGLQFIVMRQMSNMDDISMNDYVINVIQIQSDMMSQIAGYYPVSTFIQGMLTGAGIEVLISLLAVLAVNALVFVLFVFLADRWYFTSLLLGQEKAKTNGKAKRKTKKEKGIQRSPMIRIFIADIQLLLKTPIYLFNNVSVAIIIPLLMFVMPMFAGSESQINMYREIYSEAPAYFSLFIGLMFVFVASSTGITATTFSREGETSWISRVLPIEARDQILGRGLSAVILQTVTVVLSIGGISIFAQMDPLYTITDMIIGVLLSLPVFLLGFVFDLKFPKLHWDNPQQAVKQNMNVVYMLLIGIGYLLILGGVGLGLVMLNVPYVAVGLVYIVISIIPSLLLWKYLTKNWHRLVANMDN